MERQKLNTAGTRGGMKAIAGLLLVLGSAGMSSDAFAFTPGQHPHGPRGVDILFLWNNVVLDSFPKFTFAHSRDLALVHVAMHDAINSIHSRYETYAGPVPASHNASPEAAATAAAHSISVMLHPELEDYLDGVYEDSLAAIPDSHRKTKGIQVGEAAAQQLWLLRVDDGSNAPAVPYIFPTPGPGVWQPVPPVPPGTPPITPQWRFVDTWALESGAQFLAPPPPALTSDTFQDDFDEVKSIGAAGSLTRTQDQSEAALWWGAQTGMVVINRLAQQLIEDFDVGFYKATRILALSNIVLADVSIHNIDSKETWQFWRPYTAITVDFGVPGLEIDPSWTPFLPTPPNQEYPAGHPEGGGATVGMLSHFFGSCTLPSPIGYTSPNNVYRTFTTIPEVQEDVITARVAGGMHYRNSGEVGAALGDAIAEWAISHVLLPIDDD